MTELSLYKFVNDNNIEYHWDLDKTDVFLFVNFRDIKDFHSMLDYSILDDEGIECNMKDGYFGFKMDEICQYYQIELENVFSKEF